MKISRLFNGALRLLGVKLVRLSTLQKMQSGAPADPAEDIRRDKDFMALFERVHAYSMTGLERAYSLYKSLQFLHQNSIAGDLVECGVWRGGSCMLMAHFLKSVGDCSRRIYLFDTFEGMVAPGAEDGQAEKKEWERLKIDEQRSNWCRSSLDEVKNNLQKTGYPSDKIVFVKGRVEETLPASAPSQIALLRLDTDWYSSTKHELVHLFPLLNKKGILLVDDYGAWQGAQKATDEYFNGLPYFLSRIDSSGRLLIKT